MNTITEVIDEDCDEARTVRAFLKKIFSQSSYGGSESRDYDAVDDADEHKQQLNDSFRSLTIENRTQDDNTYWITYRVRGTPCVLVQMKGARTLYLVTHDNLLLRFREDDAYFMRREHRTYPAIVLVGTIAQRETQGSLDALHTQTFRSLHGERDASQPLSVQAEIVFFATECLYTRKSFMNEDAQMRLCRAREIIEGDGTTAGLLAYDSNDCRMSIEYKVHMAPRQALACIRDVPMNLYGTLIDGLEFKPVKGCYVVGRNDAEFHMTRNYERLIS